MTGKKKKKEKKGKGGLSAEEKATGETKGDRNRKRKLGREGCGERREEKERKGRVIKGRKQQRKREKTRENAENVSAKNPRQVDQSGCFLITFRL